MRVCCTIVFLRYFLNIWWNIRCTSTFPSPFPGNDVPFVFLNFEGPIPESLSLLQRLEELWLNRNHLNGVIPAGLGHLPRLRELYLNANELVGGIPSSFGELGSLEGLDLSWNQLSGGIAPCLGNMVRFVCLVSYFENSVFTLIELV